MCPNNKNKLRIKNVKFFVSQFSVERYEILTAPGNSMFNVHISFSCIKISFTGKKGFSTLNIELYVCMYVCMYVFVWMCVCFCVCLLKKKNVTIKNKVFRF